jgi:hypothetical protein
MLCHIFDLQRPLLHDLLIILPLVKQTHRVLLGRISGVDKDIIQSIQTVFFLVVHSRDWIVQIQHF